MSALAVETSLVWAGRGIVRAAGRPVLHVVGEGVLAPAVPMFTVPLECEPDAERAPGVRPWAGPVTESSICPACLRSLRGEPEPETPRLVPAGVAEELPTQEAEHRGRHLQAVPDPVTYAEAPLPAEHAERPITWSRWTTSPVISHYDPSCEWCGDPGPGEMAGGRQGHPASKAVRFRRFIAYRCTACQEMTAYEQVGSDLQTIAHHKSRAPKDCNR
ncbi:hypothetical protein [Streptomyces sp. SP18BB07]|uniref:hypothetical protein n=1 Tax=Streptomyces sp. SP18BB07 TaxID=3002522 RepID=UPI002E75CC37|nr:hypothetical protein [Streptomyces sp. SP18BB07]MEE1764379.1 hypothetical protein [Streptomyces sp. SP18BB07]